MVRKLQSFLEKTFGVSATDADNEAAINEIIKELSCKEDP
jgi:hypothetical protein